MAKNTFVYVSGWHFKPGTGEYGISVYKFNAGSGTMELIEKVETATPFNFTFCDKERGLLYALAECIDLPGLRGGGGGRIFVFKIDKDNGTLTKVDIAETWCPAPCYLALDETKRFMIVSNHSGHSCVTKIGQDAFGKYYPIVEWDDAVVELFSVQEDGTIGELLDVDKHFGSSPVQAHSHPHSAVRSPSGKLFAVCDKGNDTVSMYGIDQENGKIVRPKHIYVQTPGKEPRYCVFHPQKPWFYHNNENSTELDAYTYTEEGELNYMGSYPVLAEGIEMQENILAQQDLVIDKSGRYIYNITYGPNVITVFKVNQANGTLRPIQHKAISGKWPRGCALSPDERFFLATCLTDGKIIVYKIGADGQLKETGIEQPNSFAAYITFCVT